MLRYTPYVFDLNAGLPRYLRDSAHRMISFANRSGECWFSVRTFGRVAGLSKSSASRHLALLTRPEYAFAGRRWVPGVGYLYRIEPHWLARGAVSHGRAPGVPRVRTKEESAKNKGDFRIRYEGELPDERGQWAARVRGMAKFWLPTWGPKPGERGCWVPREFWPA